MAALKYLILHCSATKEGQDIQPETILKWHTGPKVNGYRGWSKPGYSKIITIDGKTQTLIENNEDLKIDNWEITYGVKGINSESIHICYIGGLDANLDPKDTRTLPQTIALIKVINWVLDFAPDILIAGHNQFNNKACPSFYVPLFLRGINIQDKNIYKKDPFNYG